MNGSLARYAQNSVDGAKKAIDAAVSTLDQNSTLAVKLCDECMQCGDKKIRKKIC